MARVRVHDFSISIDGYGPGPNQSTEDPLTAADSVRVIGASPSRTTR